MWGEAGEESHGGCEVEWEDGCLDWALGWWHLGGLGAV